MNQFKKKKSFLSVLMENENFTTIITLLLFVGWIFGTYYVGKFMRYINAILFDQNGQLFDDDLPVWINGLFTEMALFIVIAIIIGLINLLAKSIHYTLTETRIMKILQLLPISEEEIKNSNITSYKLFETTLINLFKDMPKEISDGTFQLVESTLFETIVEYLSLDNTIICNKKGYCDPETGETEDPKVKFAKLRSSELAKYLFKDGELFEVEVLLKRF